MSQRRSFYRKIAYAVAIAVLLIPLAWLSRPAVSSSSDPDGQEDPGGYLAQLRTEYKLSQSNLGEIDPASETMKFATLGLRGVATTILWEKANEYKMKEDWSNFEATLDQLIKLQPNYISVWQHQAWNVSYNLSVEFDDYRDRYFYVMRGIDFLEEGIKYNEMHPVLLSDLGWFVGQKIGRADEHKEYRRLFREDNDYHPEDRVGRDRDNWIVSRNWYLEAHRSVDELGKPLKTAKGQDKGELLFYNHAPMSLMNYGEAITEEGQFGSEEEGTFGRDITQAWDQAGQRWYLDEEPDEAYGNRLIKHSTGMRFRLNDLEDVEKELEGLAQALDELAPGLREEITEERRSKLSEEQRAVLEIPLADRDQDQYEMADMAEAAIFASHLDVANRIQEKDPENSAKAIGLARAAAKAEIRINRIKSYQSIVNFRYWRTRTQFEKTANALQARKLAIEADKAHEEVRFEDAKELFEDSFALWKAVFDEFPDVAIHGVTGDDVLDVIGRYRELLIEMELPFPEDFLLWDIIAYHDQEGAYRDLLEAHRAAQSGETADDNENEVNDGEAEPASDEPESPEKSEEPPAEEAKVESVDESSSTEDPQESDKTEEEQDEPAKDTDSAEDQNSEEEKPDA